MLKAVIFDLDGTIGNTLPLCVAAFRKAIEPLAGRTLSDGEIIATFGPSEEGTIRSLIPHRYKEGITAYLKHYGELHSMCPAPFDGMEPLLQRLKSRGMILAMVTGKGERSCRETLDYYNISPYFERIETGSPLGPRKAEGIRNVLDFYGLQPQEAIYVGDAPSDITACREVGIPVISAAWAETASVQELEALSPDELFTTLAEFDAYLEGRME